VWHSRECGFVVSCRRILAPSSTFSTNCLLVLGSAITLRIVDPRLKRVDGPTTRAPAQVHRRGEAPGGDSPIQGGSAQRCDAKDIANSIKCWRRVRLRAPRLGVICPFQSDCLRTRFTLKPFVEGPFRFEPPASHAACTAMIGMVCSRESRPPTTEKRDSLRTVFSEYCLGGLGEGVVRARWQRRLAEHQ